MWDESSWEHPMDQYYRNLFLKVQPLAHLQRILLMSPPPMHKS
eukprot:COSAG01_NODE_1628_length_9684_cov_9.777673_14_plen_43_part_00